MQRYTVAVLVKNRFGVLNRVTSMFRRRQFNIDNLTVSETESPELSRITVQFDGEETNKQQLINQLYKLPDVVSISELNRDESVTVELMLIKMSNSPEIREELLAAAQAFDARTVDYSKDTIIFQMAADPRRIDAFVNLMKDYGIMEICRTGIVSLERGGSTIRKVTNY
ncbi:MAG TPA: acetolactate synthase small subunit [Candidatus Faeciplasma avium]|uniref:Acetolactate synthase small subunit n=1 Tax=Candidatus Faeciplasma avium TaxID=2840798 RepID=A0A9D1NP45_9FIRM|nr:acetolactate synthase small subunit [Candidatus Faeciplasma avium]